MDSNSKVEYAESSQVYTTKYVRNSKAVGVLWAIFTICFAIINVVVFVQPQWIGDTPDSRGTGHFGLYRHCTVAPELGEIRCKGRLDDFGSIPNPAFRASTVFVGLSVIIILLCICSMLFFFFFSSSTVFHICGWMQLFSAVCMIVGVLAYPAGWDSPEVRAVCGDTSKDYALGDCGIRWAYFLAIIAVFDVLVLAILAFVLSTRYVKLQPEPIYVTGGSMYKGEVNGAFIGDGHSMTGSRKSMNLQPVMLLPQPGEPDRYSEYSHRTARSKVSGFRNEYNPSVHNFQL